MAATMGIEGVVSEGLKVSGDKSPCPATLLLIVGEPFTVDQKDLILERIVSELYSWDSEAAKCDVEEQLGAFAQQQPRGQDGPNGEKIFELKSDVLRVTVLLNPRLLTVREKIHSFLLTPSHYRHLLYSGLALHGTGCWILQDGIFTFSCLSELFQKTDIADALGHESDGVLDISTLAEGGSWNEGGLKKLAPRLKVRLNPPKSQRKEDGMVQFSDILSHSLKAPPCIELLQATDIVGNISFQRPTIYIFPAGRGDSALFGISGFNLLVNGGYCRRSCFWQFIRHLLRIDAIVVSHIAPDNIFGISSFFERKATEKTSPDLGAVYLNIGETKPLAPNGALPVSTGLVVSLADEGAGIVDHLRHIGMAVSPCTGSPPGQPLQSFNLYFKVGHGSLDLYVLNPLNGKDLSNFLSSWAKNINTKSGLPLSDEQSVCCLLVWKPASPKEKVVRILFPGNAPQSKIFEGIERLKNVAVFQTISGHVEKPAASGKAIEKKAAPVAGKQPVNKQAAPVASDAEPKKPVGSHVEQKPAAEHKETKKPADHKEIRRTMDHKTSAKAETETKKAEGRQGPEHKEVKKVSAVDSKKTPIAPTAASAASAVESKAVPAKQHDSTPGKQVKIPEKAVKDAKNKKVAKETQEVKTPGKRTPGPKERAGATTPATPSGKAEKVQKRDETPAKSEGQKKEKAAASTAISAVTQAVKEPVLSQPNVAKPDVAEPVVAKPVVADPVVAKPDVAEPVIAEPVVAKPEVAEPVIAEPDVAEPVVAKPVVADPFVAEPVVAKPVVAEPVVAEPVTNVAEPVIAKPVAADPVVAKPVVADPVVAEPFVADPVVAKPVAAEPVITEPFFTEPFVADPVVAKPVAAEPVITEPFFTEPFVADPVVAKPVAAEPVITEPFFTEPVAEEEPLSHESKEFEFARDQEKLAEVSCGDNVSLTKEEALDEKEFDFDEKLVAAEEEDKIKEQSIELERHAASAEVKAVPEFSLHAEHESLVATGDKFDKAEDSAGEDEMELPEALKSPVASVSMSTEEAVPVSSLQSEELETPEKVHSTEAERRISSEEDQVAKVADQLQPVPEKRDSNLINIEAEEEFVHTEKQSHPTAQDLQEMLESAAYLEDEGDQPDDISFSPVEKVHAETLEEVESVRSEQNVPDEDHSVPTEKELLETPEKLESPKGLAPEVASAYTEKDLMEMPEKGFEDREDFSSGDASALFEKELPKAPGQAEGIKDESFSAHRQKDEWVPMEEADNDELAAVEETHLEDDDDWEEESRVHGKVSRKDHEAAPFDPEKQWGPPEGLPAPMNGKEGAGGKKGDQSLLHNTSVSGPKKSAATQLNASVVHGKKTEGKDTASKSKRPATAPEDLAKDKKDDAAKLARGAASAGGPAKKAASVSKPNVKDSNVKTSHGLEPKKASSKPVVPFYVDLTYIPSHGDLRRLDMDFFRTVRARYYVLSSPEPDPQVLSLLLDAKQSWENNSEMVTIIPTYDSDALTSWATENQDRLKKVNVEIAPSASRCTMQLQEREASCMAYRLEF